MKNLSQSKEKALLRTELRTFGFVMACGVILMFGLLFPWLLEEQIQMTHWSWKIAAGFISISIFVPIILKPFQKIWLFVGDILGFINTRIILGIIYLMIFTPSAIILKILGKDPMRRSLKPAQESYRIDSAQPKFENLNRPY